MSTCGRFCSRRARISSGRRCRVCGPNTRSTNGALDDRFAFLRGDAAADADDDFAALVLQALPHAQLAEHLLLRLLADGAGVDQDDVGVVRAVGQFQAIAGGKHIGHLGRVVLVHLATVGLDVQLALDLVGLARTSGQGNEGYRPAWRGKTSGVPVMALNPFGGGKRAILPASRRVPRPVEPGHAWLHSVPQAPRTGSSTHGADLLQPRYAAASSASICRERSKAVIALIRAMGLPWPAPAVPGQRPWSRPAHCPTARRRRSSSRRAGTPCAQLRLDHLQHGLRIVVRRHQARGGSRCIALSIIAGSKQAP